jgi:hypothetical protein
MSATSVVRRTGSDIPLPASCCRGACRSQTVADLLGDDEKTVREHYSRWVPERQERLTKILKDAFSERLTATQGGRA